MGGLENAMGIQNGNRGTVNCPLSDLRTSVSETTMPLEVVNNPFLASSSVWDPLVSLSHSEFAHSAYPLGLENQGMSGNSHSHLIQHTSDSNFADMVPNVTSFGSGNLSEIVGSFSQNEGFNFKPNQNQMRLKNNEQSQVEGSKEDETGSAPSENRRKRGLDYNSTLSPSKDAEGDAIKDSSGKSSEQYEKKPKVEENSGVKQAAKQKKDESHSGEAPKENYVHVRARRGQATNSHSLAERVRREKISERMRLLQELVPGCNKITGKALMLDEIINYVQSLQQQVEFLSMKLATVNPELNFDVERILSKDIIQSRIGHGPIGGYGAAISSSHPLTSSGSFQGSLSNLHTTSTQFPPLSQAVLDQEFQNLFGIDNSGPNGKY